MSGCEICKSPYNEFLWQRSWSWSECLRTMDEACVTLALCVLVLWESVELTAALVVGVVSTLCLGHRLKEWFDRSNVYQLIGALPER